MVAITLGTGGTLVKTTAEGQLLEIISFLQKAEANTTFNPSKVDYVAGTCNLNNSTFSGSYNIPITRTRNSTGQLVSEAKQYLTGITFTAGTDGTFKSNNPAQYLLEIVTFLQEKELTATDTTYGVTDTTDGDTMTISGSITLPLEMSIENGNTIFSAKEYV
ncbi:hypothetical protein NIES4103_31250 [Nostoc sp. NIES-4103]|nr:hypothetical protein NIES4103_31250 [Nostoc sp. NIES-4103]